MTNSPHSQRLRHFLGVVGDGGRWSNPQITPSAAITNNPLSELRSGAKQLVHSNSIPTYVNVP
jgi:hypothetical protein